MSIVGNFVSEYGTQIIFAALTALAGFLGAWVKKMYERHCNDKTKQAVAKTCVKAVEQLYKDIHGEEKFNKCAENLSEMLAVKGITISEIEIKMLVEAALAEFNKAFDKTPEAAADEVAADE